MSPSFFVIRFSNGPLFPARLLLLQPFATFKGGGGGAADENAAEGDQVSTVQHPGVQWLLDYYFVGASLSLLSLLVLLLVLLSVLVLVLLSLSLSYVSVRCVRCCFYGRLSPSVLLRLLSLLLYYYIVFIGLLPSRLHVVWPVRPTRPSIHSGHFTTKRFIWG